jgi:hypothetical protein
MKALRILTLLVISLVSGCASQPSVQGYYRYPHGITYQWHLKVEPDTVTLVSLEKREVGWVQPYIITRAGEVYVQGLKELLRLRPTEEGLVNHDGKMYRRVTDERVMMQLEGIIREYKTRKAPNPTSEDIRRPADGSPKPSM